MARGRRFRIGFFFKRIRYFLRYTLIIGTLILVMIVNNGNILTDGHIQKETT